jgi:hypothetical protein
MTALSGAASLEHLLHDASRITGFAFAASGTSGQASATLTSNPGGFASAASGAAGQASARSATSDRPSTSPSVGVTKVVGPETITNESTFYPIATRFLPDWHAVSQRSSAGDKLKASQVYPDLLQVELSNYPVSCCSVVVVVTINYYSCCSPI